MPFPGGQHTVHELADLYAAFLYEMTQIESAFSAAAEDWARVDQVGFDGAAMRLREVSDRFDAVRDTVERTLKLASAESTPSWDYVPALDPLWPIPDVFDALLDAFHGSGPAGTGFNGVDADMRDAPDPVPSYAPSYKDIPHPTAPDMQLAAYQLTDTAAKAVESAVQTGSGILTLVLLGGGLYVLGRILGR
jgi:hypothetical protein